MSDTPNEMHVSIDYGDGTVEEHVVTPGFMHFYPYADDQKYYATVTVVGEEAPTEPEPEEPEPEEPDEPDEPDVEPETQQAETPAGFDPTAHTVQDVKDFVTANPGEAQAVLDLEVASQNRVTLVSWLESFISSNE